MSDVDFFLQRMTMISRTHLALEIIVVIIRDVVGLARLRKGTIYPPRLFNITATYHNKMIHNTEIDVRPMEIGDLATVFYLGERLFTADRWPALYRTWDEFEVVTFFASDNDTCFVATRGEKVVGFALGNVIEKDKSAWRYGYLVWLGVDPELERAGVGSVLFETIRDKFIELGARMILVDTDANNEPAIRFFKKHGFDHENKHVYLSMNLTHSPEYQMHRRERKS